MPSTQCSILNSYLWSERIYTLLGEMDVGSRKLAQGRGLPEHAGARGRALVCDCYSAAEE